MQVYLSPGLCPDFSQVTSAKVDQSDSSEMIYAQIRISQVYSLVDKAIRTSISDGGVHRSLGFFFSFPLSHDLQISWQFPTCQLSLSLLGFETQFRFGQPFSLWRRRLQAQLAPKSTIFQS